MSDVEVSDKERLLADPDEDDDDDDGASGLSSDYETSSVVSSSGQLIHQILFPFDFLCLFTREGPGPSQFSGHKQKCVLKKHTIKVCVSFS